MCPITHATTPINAVAHPPLFVYKTITLVSVSVKRTRFVYKMYTPAGWVMPDREARTIRIDPDVWASFRSQINDWDGENPGHIGYHVENALREYVDADRYSRVEDKLDRVLARVSDGGDSHTHMDTGASETVERARQIYRRVADNHGLVLKDDDLTRAIEDHAGADDRTIAKYKEILKRRGLIFEHPADSPVWTTDREKWVTWIVNHVDNDPTLEIQDMIDDYGITTDRFDELAAEVTT